MSNRPDWQYMAVHLLQGPIFDNEQDRWHRVQATKGELDGYFRQIGLHLIVDPREGYAYLERVSDEEAGDLPRIIRRRQLSLGATIYGFFLRQELDRVLKDDPEVSRVKLSLRQARDLVAEFFPSSNNETADRQTAMRHLGDLAELGFLRKGSDPGEEPVYELTRLLRAKFNPGAADEIIARIRNHISRRNGAESESGTTE